MQNITRRNLVAGTAAAAAVASLGAPVFASAIDAWDAEYDVIVVGAGGAGLTAAITVATEGEGDTCLLIEKCENPMGNTPYCLGYVLACNDGEQEHLREYLEHCIGECTPGDVIDVFIEGLAETRQWLFDRGANEDDMFFVEPNTFYGGEYPEFPYAASETMLGFTGAAGGPTHIQNFLFDTAMAQDGITYMNNTALEELVKDAETGAIVGIIANGMKYKANKGVIMCCGGFENDPEMINTYMGVTNSHPLAGAGNTGDGHRACMKIGADFWHMYGGALFWMGCRDLEDTKFLSYVWNFSNKQYGIVVGVNGRRFYMDYDGCAVNPEEIGPDLALNVGYRHGVTQFGGNWSHLSLPPKGWYIFDADNLTGAVPPELSEDPVADGFCLCADTIEELAELIEVPVDELVLTVGTWNGFCEGGKDLAFYRPAESLTPIKTGPFYAMRCSPAILNTDGGPRRDACARILDPFGEPIPGLYSAGEFGSVWGHLYQGSGNVGECLAFGRIAARSAMAGK